MRKPNQPVDRTAAPRMFGEGESPRAAFGHWQRSITEISDGDPKARVR